jgi:hypothetical protein
MWLFNVTREIFRCAGRTVLPEKVPQSTLQVVELAHRDAWTDRDPNKVWILKVHGIMARELPKSRIITSFRDPRDVLVSYRHFMNTTFENAIAVIDSVVQLSDAYRSYPPELLLWTDYEDIAIRPAELIQRLADFLAIRITPKHITETVEKFSREKVKQLIEQTNQRVLKRIQQRAPVDRDEVVLLGQNNFRSIDPSTGFQTGHISDNQSGSWRAQLSDEEKRIIHERIGDWIVKRGLPLE